MASKIDRYAGNPFTGSSGEAPVSIDSDTGTMKFDNNGTTVENVDLAAAQTVTGIKTFSGGIGDSGGVVVAKTVSFTEDSSGTSYTGTVPLPAGSQLLDIVFVTGVLWGGTSASLIIGDDDDANGYLAATNLKATELLVGEQFRLSAHGSISAESGQTLGKEGAYVVNTTGQVGQATADAPAGYYTTANNIIAVITPGAADGTAGRSYMTVLYSKGTAIASVNV